MAGAGAPWQHREIAVGSVRTHFVECGEGEPVVFVHGYASDWRTWEQNLQAPGPGYRSIALDLVGHGRSAKPLASYTIPYYGRFLEAFLEALELPPATLVGVSLGGAIVAQTAIERPGLVRRLVIVDGAGMGRKPQSLLSRLRFVPPLLWQLLGRPHRPTIRRFLRRAIFADMSVATEAFVDMVVDAQRASRLASLLTGVALGFPSAHLYPRLDRISVPTLVVWGPHDRTFPLDDAHAATARIPNARLVLVEGAGHVPMQERPEAFNRLLREFLQSAREPGKVPAARRERVGKG